MNKTKKRRCGGIVLIVLGFLLFLGAAGLAAYNIWDSNRAAMASDTINLRLMEEITDRVSGTSDSSAADPDLAETDDTVNWNWSAVSKTDSNTPLEMPVVEIDGYAYVGLLEIPSLNLRLPVMDRWDYTRLSIAACLFSGSYFTDDMVICAHNYISLFDSIRRIAVGESVYFTTVDGTVLTYIVTNVETLQPAQVEEMIQNQHNSDMASQWDMTMFTCNTGGQTRCAVRCERIDSK